MPTATKRGQYELTLTLPAWFSYFPDQHKQRTSTSAGAVHCRSKPSHTVQLHRLLQICSTHSGVNDGVLRLTCRTPHHPFDIPTSGSSTSNADCRVSSSWNRWFRYPRKQP